MTGRESGERSACPLCGEDLGGAQAYGLGSHLPHCPDRERVLDELEERARQRRREARGEGP